MLSVHHWGNEKNRNDVINPNYAINYTLTAFAGVPSCKATEMLHSIAPALQERIPAEAVEVC
jgi:hypothetical protein